MMKNLGNRLIRFFRDQKLRRKLMFTNFFLIIFPLLFFTMISNRSVSKTIESQVLFSEEQVFEQTHSFLSYKIKKVISVSDIISVDKNIIAILTKDLADYDTAAQMQDLYDLSTFYLTPHQNKEDVYRIRLYVRDEVIYSKERVNLFSIEEIKSTAWYKMLLSSNSKILWCSPDYFAHEADEDNRVISAARVIKDPNMYDRMLGIYRIDILESHVIEILKKANITKNSLTYLINSEGKVVATSDAYRTSEFVVPYKTISDLAAMERNFTEIRLNNEKYLLGSKSIAGTDWHLVSLIPYHEILSSSTSIQNRMVLLFLIIGTLSYAISYGLLGSITNRIQHLIEKMKKAQDGTLKTIDTAQAKDEIGELVVTYNYMIEKIKLLIEEEYLLGKQAKSSELKALQEQINPHFLYNTLDLINWAAIRNNVPEISSVVQSLSKFYKLSLSRGQESVSIEDELKHVSLYISIQNMRFDNKINYQTDIDPAILPYSILRITLQPLAENAVLHGILEKGGCGTLKISGRLEGETILLTVEDDGQGIPEEKLDSILAPSAAERHGYGIANVNQRIQIHYGEKYGLTYYSTYGKGTRVEIRIPAVKAPEYRALG